jgi:hypothetical protein
MQERKYLCNRQPTDASRREHVIVVIGVLKNDGLLSDKSCPLSWQELLAVNRTTAACVFIKAVKTVAT